MGRAFMITAVMNAGCVCLWGCGDEAEAYEDDWGSDGDSDGDADMDNEVDSDAPIPGVLHNGWQRPDCPSCHGPGNPDHFDEHEPWECAGCHGGNGATHPPRVEHGFERCTFTCHTDLAHPEEEVHHVTETYDGYLAPEECNGCHWSTLNTD